MNKLRAYALQEQGLDTLQADRHLGFRADERDYAVACAMLKDLGIDRVVLLTNNPNKIAALDVCEIEVVSRMPLPPHQPTRAICAPNENTPVIWQPDPRAQRTSDSWFDRPVLQAC